MKDYHFDIGNSHEGPLGMCAVVQAKSKREAAKTLREALPDKVEVPVDDSGVICVNVYLNGQKITKNDIDYSEPGDS